MTVGSALLSLTVVALACAASGQPAGRQPAAATIAQLQWLARNWIAANPPLVIEERWTPASGGAMLAVSRTVKGSQMVGFEYLRIVERDGGLVYVAQPNGEPPTEFVLTAVTRDSATFENPQHDFPKMIHYALQADGTMVARVSDGGQRGESVAFTPLR